MKYFDSLPKILQVGNFQTSVLTNLMARASFIPSVLNDPLVFYSYDIQDGDTPEIVAYKYYGDSYRYWIVLYTNQMTDPQWDWPLSRNNFDAYITEKYTEFDPYAEVHHYEKIITSYDAGTQTTTTETIIIDETAYNELVESTNFYSLPTGQVSVEIRKSAVSYYDYELNLNESKRSIKILNKSYADRLENEFQNLMG